MIQNQSLAFKLCQKKTKIKKKKKQEIKNLNIRFTSKKLNRKEVLKNHLKFENKELTYKLAEKWENLKEKATKLQKSAAENRTLEKHCYQKARTRKLEANKAKKIESFPSLLLKLEDLREQLKFIEKEKLLLKEQLDNFKSTKIELFKKVQYSNNTRAA